jgi:putative nucleotidyltransferase with HDIG domain
MTKDAAKASSGRGPTRTGSLARVVRTRSAARSVIRRAFWGRGEDRWRLIEALTTRRATVGAAAILGFFLAATIVTILARESPLAAVGRIMDDTRLVRIQLNLEDRTRTQEARESARLATPRVYRADLAALDEIESSLEGLPRLLSASPTLADVPERVRLQFNLTDESFAAIKAEAVEGRVADSWVGKVRTLGAALRSKPLVDRETFQLRATEGTSPTVTLLTGESEPRLVLRSEVVNVEDQSVLAAAAQVMARDAGFSAETRSAVIARLTGSPKPTYRYDAAETARAQLESARRVEPVRTVNTPGQIIFQRGQRLTLAQADLYRAEILAYNAGEGGNQPLIRRIGLVIASLGVTAALAGYVALFCPRIRTSPARMVWVAALLAGALGVACLGTAVAPGLAAVTVTVPSILVAILVCIAYERRSALAFALLQGLLACVALRAGIGPMIVIITGVACVVSTLREIRDRNSLVRTSVVAMVGTSLATFVVGILDRPLVPGIFAEIAQDSVLAGLGVLSVGAVTLLALPLVERFANVTTGLSLLDLRDPKQPLLRELQLRAPGTYNHSLSVASIAEAAAEAVGADPLLTYVGALYHDIGKMNKPEYFVENQFGGPNKHDKLAPAMSLMVVVGHVKDGMELARDFNLPRSVRHFIESHHGTTLVEYFYHRARHRAAAEADNGHRGEQHVAMPNEFDYRYPGPKPHTKEAAILMLADAVESATRSLSDPTPSRIEALVRALAHKRLLDGQFDESDLTLRDLSRIVDSIARTIASMYHGRIAYPSPIAEEPEVEIAPPPLAPLAPVAAAPSAPVPHAKVAAVPGAAGAEQGGGQSGGQGGGQGGVPHGAASGPTGVGTARAITAGPQSGHSGGPMAGPMGARLPAQESFERRTASVVLPTGSLPPSTRSDDESGGV